MTYITQKMKDDDLTVRLPIFTYLPSRVKLADVRCASTARW